MKNLVLSLVAVVLSVFLGLLGTKIVLSVSSLFGLTFLTEVGFLKMYGLLSIASFVLYKDKDVEDDFSEDERVKKIFERMFRRMVFHLMFWGLCFLMYNILS